jgi:hypothetical protein
VDILTLPEMAGFFIAFLGGNMGGIYFFPIKKAPTKSAEALL